MARPLLLGHRGCRIRRLPFGRPAPPENSIAAFDLCLAAGCDGFELDVRATADKHLVVCHDPKLRGRVLADLPYEQFAKGPSGLCLLENVLQRYQHTAYLDIEIKVPGIEAQVAELIQAFRPTRGFVISSFLPTVIEHLHATDASIQLGFIFDHVDAEQLWRGLPITHVIPHFKLLSRDIVHDFQRAGFSVMPWTVNRPAAMKRLAEWQVDGVISDDPRLLGRVFSRDDR